MPGTDWVMAARPEMPACSSCAADTAVMLIAVSCTVEARFSAVTTISSSAPTSSAALRPPSALLVATGVGFDGMVSATTTVTLPYRMPRIASFREVAVFTVKSLIGCGPNSI